MKTIAGFENIGRYIAYPFREDTNMSGVSGAGTFVFPDDVIKDLQFYSLNNDRGSLRLQTLLPVSGASRELRFLRTIGSSAYVIALTLASGTLDDTELEIASAGVYHMKLRLGAGVDKLFAGAHTANTYVFDEMEIEPTLLRSEKNHYVTSMSGSNLIRLTGDINIKEGYNISVGVLPARNVLRLSASKGAGQGEPCEYFFSENCCEHTCEDDPTPGNCSKYIFYINGLHPDWFGNFLLQGGPGIKVSSPGGNIVELTSTVSQEAPECEED